MQFEGVRRNSRIPNLTPLIDIVFLLLVFFMLTSHFVNEERIPVELPEADSGESIKQQDEPLEIGINAQGQILIHKHFVEPHTLVRVLNTELQKRSNKRIRIRGDKTARLDLVVRILDAARQANAESVDIIAQSP